MAEKITLARPYAKAVFDLAKKKGDFERWSQVLNVLTIIVTDPRVAARLKDYTINPKQFSDFVISVGKKDLSPEGEHLVALLANRRRLSLLPIIYEQYEKLREAAENTVVADCITVEPLSKEEQEKLRLSLSQKLGKNIELDCKQDPNLIGGFIIRAGDLLLDGSLRGQLMQLKINMGG